VIYLLSMEEQPFTSEDLSSSPLEDWEDIDLPEYDVMVDLPED